MEKLQQQEKDKIKKFRIEVCSYCCIISISRTIHRMWV